MRAVLFGYWIICFVAVGVVHASETVRFASGEWPPYTSIALDNEGPSTEVVRRAFAKVDIQVKFDYFPWVRAYEYVVSGEYDGSLTWQRTPQREQDVLFSEPVLFHQIVLFHHIDLSFDWTKIEELSGYLVARVNGYSYGEPFDEAVEDHKLSVTTVDYDIYALKMLTTGRIQLFPSDINVGYYLIDKHFNEKQAMALTHDRNPVNEETTSVIFSKADPERGARLMTLFNQGLEQLKQTGEYQEILTRAGLPISIVAPDSD